MLAHSKEKRTVADYIYRINKEAIEAQIAGLRSTNETLGEKLVSTNSWYDYYVIDNTKQYIKNNETIRLYEKWLGYCDAHDAFTALAFVVYDMMRNAVDYRGSSNNSPDDLAAEWKREAQREFVRTYTENIYGSFYDEGGKYIRCSTLELARAYVKAIDKAKEADRKAQEKKKKEHEATFGVSENSDGVLLTWQNVRKRLKDSGFDVVKKGEQGVHVGKDKYNGITVTLTRPFTKQVAYTDEELEAKGFKLVEGEDGVEDWHSQSYWYNPDKEYNVKIQEYQRTHAVTDDDKVKANEQEVKDIMDNLTNGGYVNRLDAYDTGARGTAVIYVSGWKVGY